MRIKLYETFEAILASDFLINLIIQSSGIGPIWVVRYDMTDDRWHQGKQKEFLNLLNESLFYGNLQIFDSLNSKRRVEEARISSVFFAITIELRWSQPRCDEKVEIPRGRLLPKVP